MDQLSNSKELWLQIIFEVSKCDINIVEQYLINAGAIIVTLSNATSEDTEVLEPLLGQILTWPYTKVSGIFNQYPDMFLINNLKKDIKYNNYYFNYINITDQEWLAKYNQTLVPMKFGRRLWIYPKNYILPPNQKKVPIFIEPGIGFGTGQHPTTSLCLNWLDSKHLNGKSILDYGCGSGILSIAAAKLGANCVWAVDIDHQVLLAGNERAKDNIVEKIINFLHPSNLPSDLTVDILISNIITETLIKLVPEFIRRVKKGGLLILSGIVPLYEDLVMASVNHKFKLLGKKLLEGWLLLELLRK